MFPALKRHPFPVVAHFDRVVAVSFAFPEEALKCMVSKGLELDTYQGYGFITAALVWTKSLRPACFPACIGNDFFLAGYRIFTRFHDKSGRKLRGLKILRSETDKQRMVVLGNLMTGYNYRHVHLQITHLDPETRVVTTLANGEKTLDLTFDAISPDAPLPVDSPFPDWRTARRFSGPMPFTFSPEGHDKMIVIEGSRDAWIPRPIHIKKWDISLFREAPLQGIKPKLANAFAVENIDYRWHSGKIIHLNKHS